MTGDQCETHQHDLRSLQSKLGYDFEDLSLLQLALTHASIASPMNDGLHSNERLEFLGDRVLGLAIADMLYRVFPDEDEGAMARRHAALVGRDALAIVAQSLDLGEYIRMSQGELDTGGSRNVALLSNTCEAIIGAIYVDAGFGAAARFVRRSLRPLLDRQTAPPVDAKTQLQEWAQGRGLQPPEYREIARHGPPHAPIFSVEVSLQGMPPLTATGPSKKVAERAAAESLLTRIRARHDK